MQYRLWLAGVLLVVAALPAACAPGRSEPGVPAASAPGSAAAPAQAPVAGGAPTAVPALPQKINAAYSSISASFIPIWIAADTGLFAKHGLNVELSYIASGTTAIQSLVAGDVQFTTSTGAEPVAAYLGGAPVQIILAWMPTLPALFMVDPSITSPDQLRGKAIGITRFGGQPHFGARLALKHWGLNPDTDVQYLQLGGVAEILGGMQAGAVVGGVFSPPTNVQARRLGYRVLGDFGQMGIPYQASVLSAQRPYVEANPEVVRRFVRATLEGIRISLTDDDTTRAALGKYTRTEEVELLDESIAFYRNVVRRAPYASLEGLQTVLDDLAESDPRARTVQPSQFVNTTMLEQLEREGYLKELYGE